MAGILKNLGCHPIKIGGVEEHVHVFCSLSKNIAFSDLIGRLKVGRPFRAGRFISLHPGLKRLGYSVRPLCGRKKTSKLQGRHAGRPSPVASKFQDLKGCLGQQYFISSDCLETEIGKAALGSEGKLTGYESRSVKTFSS